MNTNWSRRGVLLSMAAAAVEARAATVKRPNKVRIGGIWRNREESRSRQYAAAHALRAELCSDEASRRLGRNRRGGGDRCAKELSTGLAARMAEARSDLRQHHPVDRHPHDRPDGLHQ